MTKHALVNEDLEDLIKSTRLYSIIEITQATLIDGCMLRLDEVKVVNEKQSRALILSEELKQIEKDFILKVLIAKGMYKNGLKVSNHPGFSNTPVVKRTRKAPIWASDYVTTEDDNQGPNPKRMKTGAFSCEVCLKTYKTTVTLKRHKCKK